MDDIYCFGGNPLDRASERRGDREWIAKLLGDPESRILPLRDLKPGTYVLRVEAMSSGGQSASREILFDLR